MSDKALLELTVEEFTSKLSAKDPIPGGGSGAALAGALGVALGCMVANLTIGKQKYSDVEEEIADENVESSEHSDGNIIEKGDE